MIHPPAIVAVDDNPEELAAIVAALRKLDASCLPVLVTGVQPDVAAPLRGVRLVLFDVNYLPGVNSGTAMFETAATVLERVIAKDNGPYVLLTWTSKSNEHEALMAHFACIDDLPTPAVTGFLAKERFMISGAESGDAREGGRSLSEEIGALLASHPQVDALMSRAATSASRCRSSACRACRRRSRAWRARSASRWWWRRRCWNR